MNRTSAVSKNTNKGRKIRGRYDKRSKSQLSNNIGRGGIFGNAFFFRARRKVENTDEGKTEKYRIII